MTHPASQRDAIHCLFATIFGFMLPFHLAGAGGDPELAQAAIVELIDAYNVGSAAELDLIGRLIGFSTAAMDNLRLSMQAGLSDIKVLKYRGNAVALGRLAEQCRKVLEAMQTKRQQIQEQAIAAQPDLSPIPNVPAPAAEPPPAPPEAVPYLNSAIEDDPELATTIEAMKRNVHAMLADLQARAKESGPEAPEASIAWMTAVSSQAVPKGQATIT